MRNLLSVSLAAGLFSLGIQVSALAHDPNETADSRAARMANQEMLRKQAVDIGRSAATAAERAQGPRIINGEFVAQAEDNWQWTVSLQRNDAHHCGGTFVSPSLSASGEGVVWNANDPEPLWVLTAAHCLEDHASHKYEVASGNVSVVRLDLQAVEEIFVHPKYDDTTLANDIALLKLAPLAGQREGNKRKSVSIVSDADTAWIQDAFTALNVMGWGRTSEGHAATFLQRVRVPYVDFGTCSNSYNAAGAELLPGMICAGFSSGGFDSCQGDSGSNLTYIPAPRVEGPANEPIVTGVVSWGIGCAKPNLYGVYTSVLAFRYWMEKTVKPLL
jgi:secreted trypsin-like serine protease